MGPARFTILIAMRFVTLDLDGRMLDPEHLVDIIVGAVKHLVAIGLDRHLEVHRHRRLGRAERPDVEVMRALAPR